MYLTLLNSIFRKYGHSQFHTIKVIREEPKCNKENQEPHSLKKDTLIHFAGQYEAREGQYVPSTHADIIMEADERIAEDPCLEPSANLTEFG